MKRVRPTKQMVFLGEIRACAKAQGERASMASQGKPGGHGSYQPSTFTPAPKPLLCNESVVTPEVPELEHENVTKEINL